MRSTNSNSKTAPGRHTGWRAVAASGVLVAICAPPTSSLADVRGSLQGADQVPASPPPTVANRRLYYWQEPNGAIDLRRARPIPELDLSVIVTGPGVAESTQPVRADVMGGRCRPGTLVVAPNTTLHLDVNDWFPHRFFVTPVEQPDAPAPAEDPAHPVIQARGTFETQIGAAGTYLLRDALSPLFRCWVTVAVGQQGKVVSPAADGAFRVAGLTDGDYTLRVWFEGHALAESTAHVANGHDVTVPAINLAAPAPAAGAAAGATPPAAAGGAPAAPPAAPAAPTRRHHGGR